MKYNRQVGILALYITSVVGFFIGGCDSRREPVALAVVVDISGSAWENRERGTEYLRVILQGSYLPKGSMLALVQCGHSSKIVWEGRVEGSAEILAAYQKATQNTEAATGTDIFTALELSRDWLTLQHSKGMKTTIMTGWADLRADPAKEGSRVLHTFKPASSMTWPNAQNIQVIFFGVAPDVARVLQTKWSPSVAAVTLYGSAHRIRPEDLGLKRGATF